ncbi:MAG: hypothetical protein MRECE_45c017 [Mycoplasmataceae bacterium CE_OT135]|nr:MAG: hypothetical protein MRECE_45c017 [Mycoplasmataceae bacterium CE_OT135]
MVASFILIKFVALTEKLASNIVIFINTSYLILSVFLLHWHNNQ